MEVWRATISKVLRATHAFLIVSVIILLLAPCRPNFLASCPLHYIYFKYFKIVNFISLFGITVENAFK